MANTQVIGQGAARSRPMTAEAKKVILASSIMSLGVV